MTPALEQLERLLTAAENEHLEFKEAKNDFDRRKLRRYCAALANEGGGKLILGVTNTVPRRVVGSCAFSDLGRTKGDLVRDLRLKIEATELSHARGRVVVFEVPPRPIGVPIEVDGRYWMRSGENLTRMTRDRLKRILDEAVSDFSATTCKGSTLDALSREAIARFRELWARRSGNHAIVAMDDEQLLRDAELLSEDGLTYAALILLGTHEALGRFLAQAEVIYEYRSDRTAGPAQHRREYREGCLLFLDELWEVVNTRNDVQHFQDGLFMRSIPTVSEVVIREAVLNAVAHRDYTRPESVFVRQYPRSMEIVSPGGLPPGITPENILRRQSPRNRRIAEAFARCGFVERAGQGVDRMFAESIRQGKSLPDFTHTDEHQVELTLGGQVQDPAFLQFVEQVANERDKPLGTDELLVLDLLRAEKDIAPEFAAALRELSEDGFIEVHGRGRGARHVLSRRYYAIAGKRGVYTRKRGLDRQTSKELLLRHIRDYPKEGSRLNELMQVLPYLTRRQVQWLLTGLRKEGLITFSGRAMKARWYPAEDGP